MIDYRVGDTRDLTADLPDGSVHLVASSPPFVALRSYLPADHPDKHREIGSEPDPATFLDTLLALTAEWGRVLAPWGSIAIELGDTYSGSTMTGGDDAGSARYPGGRSSVQETYAPKRNGAAWPRAKCLALVPQAYALSLAYGRNILTGQPSPAGQWLVRNMVVWHRPNPAVGALGDKYRPSTSYITVATRSSSRWFDLTAVRTEHRAPKNNEASLKRGAPTMPLPAKGLNMDRGDLGASNFYSPHGGAPPLDCWFDEHDTWTITTQPSRIKAEVTERVPCGPHDGGERTTSPDCPVHGDHAALVPTAQCGEPVADSSLRTERNDDRRDEGPSLAGACDASTHTSSSRAANRHDTESNRTDPAPATSPEGTPSARTAADTARTSASPGSSGDRPGTSASSSGEACPPAGELGTESHSGHTSDQESACTCSFHLTKTSIHSHYAMWPPKLAERLVLSMCPEWVCRVCGQPRRRIEKVDGLRGCDILAVNGANERGSGLQGARPPMPEITRTTIGWSDCGHGSVRCRRCKVLVPFEDAVRRSRQEPRSEAQVSDEALLGEPVEGASGQEEVPRDLCGVPGGISGTHGDQPSVLAELFGATGSHGGQGEHDRGDRSGQSIVEGRGADSQGRLPNDLGASWHARSAGERSHDGAQSGDAESPRPPAGEVGDRSSPQRDQGRQQNRESGSRNSSKARRDGHLPSLHGDVPGELTCRHCGSDEIEYVADNYGPGVVLDPFAGTGTTLCVADLHNRTGVGFDIDPRNADLVPARRQEVARALFGTRPELPGQLELLP